MKSLCLIFHLLLLIATQPAHAAMNQLLILSDPSGMLLANPELVIDGNGPSITVHPLDDGKGDDLAAGDHSFSASVSILSPGRYTFRLDTGTERLTCMMDAEELKTDRPVLHVSVSNGRLAAAQTDPAGMIRDQDGPRPTSIQGGTSSPDFGSALYLGFLGVGLAEVAFLLWSMRRTQRRVQPTRLRDRPVFPPHVPVRIPLDRVPRVLAGPLAGYRWVALGAPQPDGPADLLLAEEGALPAELVAAVEDLAVRGERPVALLILDASALDASGLADPLAELEALVDRRFPLVIVDPVHPAPTA